MTILQLLSQVNDVKDFRIKDILGQMGLDERQASRFYHDLIKEAREALSHIAELEKMTQERDADIACLTKENDLLKEGLKAEKAKADQTQEWRSQAINSLTKIKELEETLQEQEQLLDSRFEDWANLSGVELDILIAYLKGLRFRRLREEVGRRLG
jgi:hypothetical protein